MPPTSFRQRYGPWALVAGGSAGLGAEFARQLARRGLDLVLVAETPHPLEELAQALSRTSGVAVRTVVQDLAAPHLLQRIAPQTDDLEVGLVVCNAAHAPIAPFLRQRVEDKLRVLDLNCRAPLLLVDHYAREMATRRRGGIVIMSSLAGLLGTALVSTYAASKAFGTVLAESLWVELGALGIDVVAVCPGATRTPAYLASGARSGLLAPRVMQTQPVVSEALAALGRGPRVVTGRSNRAVAALIDRVLPRKVAVRLMARAMRATYPRAGE